MNNIKNLIGKTVRRVSFSIQDGRNYYLLFSVIELLEPDMQDLLIYDSEKKYIYRSEHSNSSKPYNIYMTVDKFVINEDFLKNPQDNYIVYNTKYMFYGNQMLSIPSIEEPPYLLKDSYQDNKADIQYVLPMRQCSKSLYAYIDSGRIAAKLIADNEYLRGQLSEVSTKHYKTDLSLFPEHLGNIYILQYNPYFRYVDFSVSYNPNGLYVYFKYRPGITETFNIRISNKNKVGFFSFEIDKKLSSNKSCYFIDLPSAPDIISIKIFDSNDSLVYYDEDMRFIQSININMNIKSKNVKLVTESESKEKVEVVEKFSTEDFRIGESKQEYVALGESLSQNAYKTLEDKLEFILFDGDKNKKDENVKKAKEVVRKILNKARIRCIICDPYFGLNDLYEFVFTMQNMSVNIRIISSKEFLGKNAKELSKSMEKAINTYMSKVGGVIQVKLLTGKSLLHDRFIIVDDDVWILGSSLNEFGNRTTTIVKVPQVSCKNIYAMAERWWTNDSYTVTLKEYANS